MAVLARFLVTEIDEVQHYEKGSAFRVKMTGAKSEPFGSATPSANCDMLIVPEAAAKEFKVGKFYLVRFDIDPNQELPKYG